MKIRRGLALIHRETGMIAVVQKKSGDQWQLQFRNRSHTMPEKTIKKIFIEAGKEE